VIKKSLFALVTIAITLVVLELVSASAWRILNGAWMDRAEIGARRMVAAQNPEELHLALPESERRYRTTLIKEVVHPYIGFVANPRYWRGKINNQGFFGPDPLDYRPDGGRGFYRVAITGGSVAMGLYDHGRGIIAREIERAGLNRGHEIEVFNLAYGGVKQPQQLMTVNYFLSLGVHFDMIINLDGFNDVVLPAFDNLDKDINPYYPRNWRYRLPSATGVKADRELLYKTARIGYREDLRSFIASVFSWPLFDASQFTNMLWHYLDFTIVRSIQAARQRLAIRLEVVSREAPRDFERAGPVVETAAGETPGYAEFARVWRHASLAMHRLSEGYGTGYFHFLQPNQYVPGSKIMGVEEREIALPAKPHPYASHATSGYSHLVREGQVLKRAGVQFYDLTMMFRDNDRLLYSDACCHFNSVGYRLVAAEIMQRISSAQALKP